MGTAKGVNIFLWALKIPDLKGLEVPGQQCLPQLLRLGLLFLAGTCEGALASEWNQDEGTNVLDPSLCTPCPILGPLIVNVIPG